jgi:hypothetical protein
VSNNRDLTLAVEAFGDHDMKHALTALLSAGSIFAFACGRPALAASNGTPPNWMKEQAQSYPWMADQGPWWTPWGIPMGEVYSAAPGYAYGYAPGYAYYGYGYGGPIGAAVAAPVNAAGALLAAPFVAAGETAGALTGAPYYGYGYAAPAHGCDKFANTYVCH